MAKIGIIGATGYVGVELARILTGHPQAELTVLTSHSYAGQPFEQVYPHFRKHTTLVCQPEEIVSRIHEHKLEVLFFALPHGHAAKAVTPALLEQSRVIDLGADFRLRDPDAYEQWYGLTHPNPDLLATAVYGLSEWHREAIREARLIANPGCYPTCSALALAPLLKNGLVEANSVIIDAKSGVSGAGRTLALGSHFNECNESIKAYGITTHRHTPEIEQSLSEIAGHALSLSFTPHLIPMNRGILATIYARLKPSISEADLRTAYETAYQDAPFVRLLPAGVYPETRWVKGANYCDIGFAVDTRHQRVIVVAAIDNLVKGAAGQAIQNMNLMLDLPETTGLEAVPLFP